MFGKNAVLITIKTLVILFIPYSWLISTSQTNPSRIDTTTAFIGTWGVWIPGGSHVSYIDFEPSLFWEQSQFLFSLLFILPLLSFALFFSQRVLDRTCIAAAGVSVLLSFALAYLSTLDFSYDPSYLVIPRVVSLATFVFVFWPLLRNSWPSLRSADTVRQKQGVPFRLRGILSEIIPASTSSLVWIILVVFPAVSTVYVSSSSGTSLWYDLSISGGLSASSYSYLWITGSDLYYPSIHTAFLFGTALLASPTGLFAWTLNLWLGVTTLRYVLGKSTLRRIRVLTAVIVLTTAFPAALFLIMAMGVYIIPLPFFPAAMLLIAKFAHAPDPITPITDEDTIRVPLRTRLSSIFRRRDEFPEVTEAADADDQICKTDEE